MPTEALNRLNNREKSTLSNLVFPDDLGSSKSQYYIQFKIFKISPQTFPKLDFLQGDGSAYTLTLKRPLVKDPEYINLYMPATVTNVQNASYQSVDIGMTASAIKAVSGDQGFQNMDFAKTLTNLGAEVITQFAKNAGGATTRNLAALAEIGTGKVVNNRTELSFDGIDRRTFTFDFKMYPRNEKEAETIKEIVKSFRSHMAPGLTDKSDTGKTLVIPSLFEIEFKPNKGNYLPLIGQSVCTSCTVNYGGDRPQFFNDGSPIETSMTVTFQELEILTKQRIEAGY